MVSWGLWLVAVGLCCVAFALAGCESWYTPKVPIGGDIGPPAPPLARGLATVDWIVGLSLLCAAGSGVLMAIMGVSRLMIRLCATFMGIAIGGLVFKVIVVKYLWLVILLSVLSGTVGAVLFAWGHRKYLEKFFNIDLNQDGTIGEKPPLGPGTA